MSLRIITRSSFIIHVCHLELLRVHRSVYMYVT